MRTYSFEDMLANSMYEHLYLCMKEDIVNGHLKANEKLPSKRTFAKNLGVSNTTVENAYMQLLTEGYIYSIPKRGYFVSKIDMQMKATKKSKEISQDDSKIEKIEYFANLMDGGVSTEMFPFSVWLKLMRHVMSTENEAKLLTERPAGGLYQLRLAITKYLKQFRDMELSPDQIIIGAGTEYLYSVLIQLLGRDAVYGLEDPGYTRLRAVYQKNDIDLRYASMDSAGVRLEEIMQSDIEVLHITPSHHLPTGIVMPIKRRHELLNWAGEKVGRYLIEDDYDCEFRLSGKPIPTLQSIDGNENVIYINTFSQSLAPAFRISYLVLPKHLVKRFYDELGFYSGTVSCFEQLTLARFLDGGHFEKHINRMRTYYRTLRDSVIKEIDESLLVKIVTIREENAGVHFLMELDTNKTAEELSLKAKEQGILLSCVSDYYYKNKPEGKPVVVFNYSGIAPKDVPEVIARLTDCIINP